MESDKIDLSFFDRVYNRRNTGYVKYETHPLGSQCSYIIPMWIADMDFEVPKEV